MRKAVLLTRSEGQNESLARRLRSKGVTPLERSMLAIRAVASNGQRRQIAMDLDRYDHVIFVSRNAVDYGVQYLEAFWPQWPLNPRWYAVGESTAERLGSFDIASLVPDDPSTEGLLAMPGLQQVQDCKVLIVRGVGGRETLRDTLAARGADVDYLEVYERQAVQLPASEQQALIGRRPAIVVVDSGETAQAFAANVGDAREGFSLVVPSARIAGIATGLGFEDVHAATGPDEDAMLAAVLDLLDQEQP